jgi:hypothetical protein
VAYIYVVTDCEFDGPVPGEHSMLSFGSVALSETGETLGEFEAVLASLDGAKTDPGTMAFWKKHPEAWQAATENAQPPAHVIDRFTHWIRSFQAEPIFTAHPVALDGPWFDYYLKRFTGRSLFEGPWVADRLFKYARFVSSPWSREKRGAITGIAMSPTIHRNGSGVSNILIARLMTLAAMQIFWASSSAATRTGNSILTQFWLCM